MVCRSDIRVVLPFLQAVKNPAQIRQRTVIPELLCPDLQLDIDDRRVIQHYFDIKDKILVAHPVAELDRIEQHD